jgi:COMPASS component SWD3
MQHIPSETIPNTENSFLPSGPQRISNSQAGGRKVTLKMTVGDGKSEVFCCKFDPEDRYLAVGYGDGMCRIYNNTTGKLSYTLSSLSLDDDKPITAVGWRPVSSTLKTANVLVTCSADGSLKHYHATSGKLLHSR